MVENVRPLRVAIDGLPLCVRSAGVATYTRELLNELGSFETPVSTTVFCPPYPPPASTADLRHHNVHRSLLYPLVMQHPWPRLAGAVSLERALGNVDVFHATAYALPARSKCALVCTIHDLTLLRYPEFGTPGLLDTVHSAVDSLPRVDRIIAVSAATKNDLIELCQIEENRIRVVHNGVGTAFSPSAQPPPAVLEGTEYLLHVGTHEPRKNLPTLLRAFAGVDRRNLHLVLAGGHGWERTDLRALAAELDIADRVRFLGNLEPSALPALYTHARLFVYPSLYEGFGLPIIEAMACGTPVICSNRAALPEVACDAAVTVEPTSVDSITAALQQVLDDADLRSDLSARGLRRARDFSWQRCARETADVYAEAAGL